MKFNRHLSAAPRLLQVRETINISHLKETHNWPTKTSHICL
jgi:hypothetical protein